MTFVVFSGVLYNGWLEWDDPVNVTDNKHLDLPVVEFAVWAFTDVAHVLRYKPINWLIWYIAQQGIGEHPGWFHLLNLVAHTVAASLLFILLRRLIERFSGEYGPSSSIGALIGSLWWAIHPARTETVAWVSGFGYPLGSLFFFAALNVYTRDGGMVGRPRFRICLSAFILFGISLAAYPVALAGPAVFILLDLHARAALREPPSGLQWAAKLPFIILSLSIVTLTVWVRTTEAHGWPKAVPLQEMGVGDRLLQATVCYSSLLSRELVPHDLHVLYQDLESVSQDPANLLVSVCMVLVTGAGFIWTRKKSPLIAFGVLFFIASTLPYLGWTEAQHFASERYSYMPSAGLAIMLAAAAAIVCNIAAPSRLMACSGAAVAWLLCFAAIVMLRIPDWRNNQVFFELASTRELGSLTEVVLERRTTTLMEGGHFAEAIESANRLVRRSDGNARHLQVRAQIYLALSRLDEAAADYRRLLHLEPAATGTNAALGYIAMKQHNWPWVERYGKAELIVNPDSHSALALLTFAYANSNRPQAAEQMLAQLIAKRPPRPLVAALVQQMKQDANTAKMSQLVQLQQMLQ